MSVWSNTDDLWGRMLKAEAEVERLQAVLNWIWDHSNDPDVVEEARKALNPEPTKEAD